MCHSRGQRMLFEGVPLYKLKWTLLKLLHQWNQESAVNVRSLDAVLYSVNAAIYGIVMYVNGITEEALVLLGEVECLHFFCSPCEGEAVDKKIVKTRLPFLRKIFYRL